MPSVIFTDPQVATVGISEEEARLRGVETDELCCGTYCRLGPRQLSAMQRQKP